MEPIKTLFKIIFIVPIVLINNFNQYKKLAESKGVEFSYFKWIGCVICLPFMFLFYLFIVSVRQLLSLALCIKYTTKFGGMLQNQDAAFTVEYPEHVMVEVIFLIESNKSAQEFYEMVREHIHKALNSKLPFNPKICGTLHMLLGYPFIIRDEVTIDECITKLKRTERDTMTKDELLKINEELAGEPLPKNNKALWQVLIGTQPVDWDESSNKGDAKVYPVKLRVSHCIGDGVHFFTGILALFGDAQNGIPKVTDTRKPSLVLRLLAGFQNFAENIANTLSFIPMLLVNSVLVTSTPYNILYGKKLSRRTFKCFNREKSSNHLQIAKNIKNRYSDVPLSSVFATAFSASLTEYFQKHSTQIPKYITCAVTEAPRAVGLISLTPDSLARRKVVCTNDVAIYIPKLSTYVETKDDHIQLVKMLRNNAKQNKQMHASREPEAYRWMISTFSPNLPVYLSGWFAEKFGVHGMITNVPGPSTITVMNGNVLKNVIFWCPNVNLTGIGLAVNTYGGSLQLTLNIDSALIPEREQVQQILDNTYRYIELLDEATAKDKK